MAKKTNPLLQDADKHKRQSETHWTSKLRALDRELFGFVDDLIQGYIDGRPEYVQKFQSQAHVARVIHARLPEGCKIGLCQLQNYISQRRSGNGK